MNVHLVLNYSCNQRCVFCYNATTVAKHSSSALMSEEAFREALRWIEDNLPEARLSFTGGEPTLYRRILRFVELAQDFPVSIITNGTFDGALIDKLRDYGVSMQFSLEGHTEELHNSIVKRGSFEEIVKNIGRALIKLGEDRVSTNTTLNALNFPHAGRIFRFAHELGLRRVSFNYASPNGENHGIVPDLSRYAQLLEEIPHLSTILGMRIRNLGVLPKCIYGDSPACSAGTGIIVIDPYLNIYACPSIAFEDTRAGTVKTSSYEDVLSSEIVQTIHSTHEHISHPCDSCRLLEACKGGCYLFWRHGLFPELLPSERRCENGRAGD
jgi:radical SAM protein with 4Fe4S-binding SPASM domain